MNVSRRNLLSGAAALTVLSPGLQAAFAATPANSDVLVVIFQRGACDWLQMLAPSGDPNYVAARPTIRVPASGTNAGIGLATLDGVDLYLSNSAPELKPLYDAGSLAFVHATGLHTADRSHFTCQDMMEKGVADADAQQNTGWLARHLAQLGTPSSTLGTVSSSSNNPASLLGDPHAVAIGNVSQFNVSGANANTNILRAMSTDTTGSPSAYKTAAVATLDTVARVQDGLRSLNTANANTAGYTGGELSRSLQSVGQLIRMNVGLSLATVDYGGWDMHNNLVGEFRQRTTEFARAIAAFWTDMASYRSRITLVTMTEFGRRVQENTSQGTDHGAASGMLVLGGGVNGGKVYGRWPGLAPTQLTSGDLAVTTDYRQVLAEILVKRHGTPNISAVFPTVPYTPLGVVRNVT